MILYSFYYDIIQYFSPCLWVFDDIIHWTPSSNLSFFFISTSSFFLSFTYKYMCDRCRVFMHMCMEVWLIACAFLDGSPLYQLRQGLSVEPRDHESAKPTSQCAPGISHLSVLNAGVILLARLFHGLWVCKPTVAKANVLSTEHIFSSGLCLFLRHPANEVTSFWCKVSFYVFP